MHCLGASLSPWGCTLRTHRKENLCYLPDWVTSYEGRKLERRCMYKERSISMLQRRTDPSHALMQFLVDETTRACCLKYLRPQYNLQHLLLAKVSSLKDCLLIEMIHISVLDIMQLIFIESLKDFIMK